MKLKFLGAAGHVTGSCYLLDTGSSRVLVDCGLFQEREHLSRNWQPLPAPVDSIDFLLLTHAHLDHSGLIPRLVRDGFRGKIFATAPTVDLARIVLHDSARIQMEDAEQKRKRHRREHRRSKFPIESLYGESDVEDALQLFQSVGYKESIKLGGGATATFFDAGHILGSAMIELKVNDKGKSKTLLFSGDIGQWDKPIVRDPTLFTNADYVVMESTYGGVFHPRVGAIEEQLSKIIVETADAGGNIVIPTFAIERAQELIYFLRRLVAEDRIPDLLVFLDSPMAADVTNVFRDHRSYMDSDALQFAAGDLFRFPGLQFTRDRRESKAINRIRGSCIILAGSGMCTAGRIKHHLVQNISRPESTIVFVGYQAQNTLGRRILDGERTVRIHGVQRDVRARIEQIHGLSAHADHRGLLRWVGNLERPPQQIFLVHGDQDRAAALAESIETSLGWAATIPQFGDEFEL